jgi:4-hydroxybenzoate polyprenyltransferase
MDFNLVRSVEIIYLLNQYTLSIKLSRGVLSRLNKPTPILDSRPFYLNYFLALSRTPHALLDVAAPGLAALLCLGSFPSPDLILIGLMTAFAGYVAVYALNDIVDYQIDRKTFSGHTNDSSIRDLDSLFVRHPLAQGLIGYREALAWTIFWGTLAMIGAYFMNPFCLGIFLLAAFLEIVYCSLLKITWLRSVVSGFVKTSGPMAAVFAVNPDPPALFLLMLFLWFFSWEIGGQNIPNDFSDMEADRTLQAVTIPVRFGIRVSILIITLSLLIAYGLSIALTALLPVKLDWVYLAGVSICGLYFLLLPAMALYLSPSTGKAFALFNRASYYPFALLVIVTIIFLIR